MENKKDSSGKRRKQPSKIFATNFFASLYFLNESLINNKGIGVSNEQCIETLKENTPLLPEESDKNARESHKKKSPSIKDKVTAIKNTTSTEEKKKKHKRTDNESISVQNGENYEFLDETVIKDKYKTKPALREHDIVTQKDSSLELNSKSTLHKNEFTSLEFVQSVTNLDILSDETIKKNKKQSRAKSAFLEIAHQNMVENEENVEDADLLGLINKVKRRYENERKSSKEDAKTALQHFTSYGEKKQKKHKTHFDEHDYKSPTAQNEENFKVLDETVIKGKRKGHKSKSAFKERDILAPKDTSLEVLDEKVKHKSKFFEERVQNVTNGEVIGEDLVKEKKKQIETKTASMEFDNENFVIHNEKNVKTANLIKKTTDQTEFSEIAEINDYSVQENHVKKKKKHKRRNADIEKEEKDNSCLEDTNSIQEDLVKKKKKHKRRNADIEKDNALLENINFIEEDSVKKKRKHKRRKADLEKEEKVNALLENINSIQEDLVKKKKKHKRRNADKEKNNALLENIDFIEEDVVKKAKKHKRKKCGIGEDNDIILLEDINSIQENFVKKKKNKIKNFEVAGDYDTSMKIADLVQDIPVKKKTIHDTKNSEVAIDSNTNLMENVNFISVKKKKKHKRKHSDIAEDNGASLIENVVSIQEDCVKKKKKHKRKKADIAGDNTNPMENVDTTQEDSVKKLINDTCLKENVNSISIKKNKRKNSYMAEENSESFVENVDSIQDVQVEKKKKYKREFSEILEDNENLDFTIEDSVKKMKKLNRELHTLGQGKNNLNNNDFRSEKPIKAKGQKYKLFSQDAANEYFSVQGHAYIESANNKDMEQKCKPKHFSFNDQIHKTQNDVGLHLSKSKKNKEVADLEHFQLSSSEDCPSNDQETMTVIQNEKNVMTSKLIKMKKHQTEFCDVRVDSDTSILNNIDLIQENPVKKKKHKRRNADIEEEKDNALLENINSIPDLVKKKKKHKRKNSDVEKKDKDTIVLESNNSIQDLVKKKKNERIKFDIKEGNDTILLENEHSIQDDPVKKKKKQRQKEKSKEKSSFEDENKLMPTKLNSENEDNLILLLGTPLSKDVSNLDLNEDPVDFEIPLLHSKERACQLKLEKKEALKSQGVVIKTGKFTAHEISLVKRNYNDFTKRFQINDPQILLGIGQTYKKKDVVAFLRAKHFYVRLGKDLPDRQLYSIYRKARTLFDFSNKETRLDKDDVNLIKKAYSRVGRKWQAIGNIIDKSAETVRQAFLWHDKSINRGIWSEEEDNQLMSAIKTVTGKTDLSNFEIKGAIVWEKIANLVPSRNCHQCRFHWDEYLSCKFRTVCWEKKDYGKLVSILRKEFYVDDFVNINWREVQKCFGDISWQFLRTKWYSLTKMFRILKKDYSKVIPYKKIVDHYCIVYNIKTN